MADKQNIISRKDAKALGLKRYFTGLSCKRGHICDRWVCGGRCIECHNEYTKRWNKENPKNRAKTSKKHRLKNKKKYLEYGKKWRNQNRDKVREQGRLQYENNKESRRASRARWGKANRAYLSAREMARYARKRSATPKWANIEAMTAFYEQAQLFTNLTGIKYQVDHVIPLQSPYVCGLHCEDNLAVITADENVKKGNRWWPDMPNISENEESLGARRSSELIQEDA